MLNMITIEGDMNELEKELERISGKLEGKQYSDNSDLQLTDLQLIEFFESVGITVTDT